MKIKRAATCGRTERNYRASPTKASSSLARQLRRGQNYRSVESLFLGATLEHFLITNCENKTMKKYMMTLLLCLFVTGTAVTFTGCDQGQGPVERAGESIDEAAEEIVDEIDDATDAK
jgi:hypothetical protein